MKSFFPLLWMNTMEKMRDSRKGEKKNSCSDGGWCPKSWAGCGQHMGNKLKSGLFPMVFLWCKLVVGKRVLGDSWALCFRDNNLFRHLNSFRTASDRDLCCGMEDTATSCEAGIPYGHQIKPRLPHLHPNFILMLLGKQQVLARWGHWLWPDLDIWYVNQWKQEISFSLIPLPPPPTHCFSNKWINLFGKTVVRSES